MLNLLYTVVKYFSERLGRKNLLYSINFDNILEMKASKITTINYIFNSTAIIKYIIEL